MKLASPPQIVSTLSLAIGSLMLSSGCAALTEIVDGGGTNTPAPAPAGANANTPATGGANGNSNAADALKKTVTIKNETDSDLCSLHVREKSLHDAYAWSTNYLDQPYIKKVTVPAQSTTTLVIHVHEAAKPDVFAKDCSGNVVMRIYGDASFAIKKESTWVITKQDQGSREQVQKERGITQKGAYRAAGGSSGPGRMSIKLVNKCGSTVEYCHVRSAGTGNSSANGNSSKSLDVEAGDTIALRSGSSCGKTVYTVAAGSGGAEVMLCK